MQLPLLAYFVLLLWLLPLMCPPYVSLERKNVFRNTNSCSTCSLFSQAKGIALKIVRSCFPALLLLHKEGSK